MNCHCVYHLRLDTPPFGLRSNSGGWTLFKGVPENERENLIFKHLQNIETPCYNRVNNLLSIVLNEKQLAYIRKYHPGFMLCDISPYLNLKFFTHFIGAGFDYQNWCGGVSGSVKWLRCDAISRTLSETIERTCLSKVEISHKHVWGSAIGYSVGEAEERAVLECVERLFTIQAYLGLGTCQITLLKHRFPDTVSFEWSDHNAKTQIFSIHNPFGIPIVLAQVQLSMNGNNYSFYGNGIGLNIEEAMQKSTIETLQFIPRQSDKYLKSLDEHFTRLWENHVLPEVSIPLVRSSWDRVSLIKCCKEIIQKENGQIFTQTIQDLEGMYVSWVILPNHSPWNSNQRVPIA